MLLTIADVLTADELAQVRALLQAADWADGRITAGIQSAQTKHNQQLPENSPHARDAGRIVLAALERSATFFAAALPRRIVPPLFNRYQSGMDFGDHIDNAVRHIAATGQRVRTDLSATLFLADPESYDGGELIIRESAGDRAVKLAAGSMVLYPGTSVHRVAPVTRGARLASFFWIESMVRSSEQRALMVALDMAIMKVRQAHGESEAAVELTGCYHNLLRMWAEV
ncbi:MAG: Fe2+-dependent dioxygenase [Burkholderiaceae bacterium]